LVPTRVTFLFSCPYYMSNVTQTEDPLYPSSIVADFFTRLYQPLFMTYCFGFHCLYPFLCLDCWDGQSHSVPHRYDALSTYIQFGYWQINNNGNGPRQRNIRSVLTRTATVRQLPWQQRDHWAEIFEVPNARLSTGRTWEHMTLHVLP